MKKKTVVFICMLCASVLFFFSCDNAEKQERESDSSFTEAEATDGATDTDASAQGEVPYWKLPTRPIKKHSELHFDLDGDFDLALSISDEWTLTKTSGAYDISREGESIGRISATSLASEEWSVIEDYSRKHAGALLVSKFVEKRGEGADAEYRYRFEYEYTSNTSSARISLCVDYVELDANAADRLYLSPGICSATTIADAFLKDDADGNYLILGNSFIGTSDIGALLDDLFYVNKKECSFRAVSRGYASVATYVSSPDIMSAIEEGAYDAVFICGFYSDGEADNLVLLEDACKISDTTLVIFPAHNESERSINLARNKCPDLPVLDWRGELELLIGSGVDKWDLCINDQHLHSTPYAGLIGAHMIYRAIYGEIPSIDGMTSINVSHAKEIFGDYLEKGIVSLTYEIYRFDQLD